MESFRGDFRDLDNLNIGQQGIQLVGGAPARRALGSAERSALKAAAEFAKFFTPSANLPLEVIQVAERPPIVSLLRPLKVPLGRTSASSRILTVALGFNVEIFGLPAGIIPVGAAVQPGIYGSTTLEFGVFISGSLGVFLNLGISAGPCLTFIFGPPSDLVAASVVISASINIPGVSVAGFGVAGGAALLFSASPFRFLGVAFSITAGVAALPVTISLQASSTAIKPLLK
jgi:hypothetical protein